MKTKKIGIIGCGNMGESIARGIANSQEIHDAELYFYDIDKEKARYLGANVRATVTSSAEELANSCGVVLIAVKPQDMRELLKEIWHSLDASKLLISAAAGIKISSIKKDIQHEVRVVRAMPNMAAFVNQSISALCYDDYATDEDKALAKKIFLSIGDIVEVEESQMDAVTAVSGSGPAYFFYLAEMLETAAVELGIEKEKAKQLATKTALGSAMLLRVSGNEPGAMRRRVASKGGTTEAAFRLFEKKKLGDILREGIKEAAKRSKELSGGDDVRPR